MSQHDDQARFDEAVRKEVEKIAAAQQAEFSKMMEKAMQASLKGVSKASEGLEKQRLELLKEHDAVKAALAKAEKEGERLAQDFFKGKQKQFAEAAQTELLRNLTRMHLEAGKSPRDIANWLDLPMKFVENIRQLLERLSRYAGDKTPRQQLDGRPRLRYDDAGRGGTIWFENLDTRFDMWWEFAGGDALVILDIPTEEQWEARTKLPLDQREKVLNFIGEQIVEDKISGTGSFIIGHNVITFYA